MQRYRRAVAAHPGAVVALFVDVLVPPFVIGSLAEDMWVREGFGWDRPLLGTFHATPILDTLMIFCRACTADRAGGYTTDPANRAGGAWRAGR